MGDKQDSQHVLEVRNLRSYISTVHGMIKGVDGVDFNLRRGEAFGVAGESGCGKSMMSLAIMGLVPSYGQRLVQGEVWYKNRDLLRCSQSEMNAIRGKELAMIFQEPMTSLNPTLSIGLQLREIIERHEGVTRQQANKKAVDLLDMVRIPSPEKTMQRYPHQLSGGMRQRVMIAMSLSCQPEILIADEPTTALDVTVQAQIMSLIKELQTKVGTAMILITHNLGLLAEFASRVMVMYLGRVIEAGTICDIFDRPQHPYTKGLLNAIPHIGRRSRQNKRRLEEIKGSVPNPLTAPQGCKFHPRCPKAKSICIEKEPNVTQIQGDHSVRCWLTD